MPEPTVPPAPTAPLPPDEDARARIRTDLASTLFVEAGAGSGKTSALVDRVLGLVVNGEAELAHIAAITFTEKAAAELRDRIRSRLTAEAALRAGTFEGDRCRGALDQLDGAAVGTLHSFAQRILNEHPIEAGLPPRIEVLDEVSSGVAFEERWSLFQDGLLEDEAIRRTLLLLFASGVRHDALRYVAQAFEDNWDLVETQVPAHPPAPPAVRPLLRPLIEEAAALRAVRCSTPDDNLCLRIEAIAAYLEKLDEIDDEVELLEALHPDAEPKRPGFRVSRTGTNTAWADVTAIRARVAALGEAVDGIRTSVATACARRIGSVLGAFTMQAAEERRSSGRLQFHDLLVLGRALLRDPHHGAAVRVRLHERYQRLLLDEFQDTDPIQIELAVRIAAADPRAEASGSRPWEEVPVAPGHLFVVGDPKQSIYRFRRANIGTFLRAEALFGAGGGRVELTANFRTVAPVIDWVNRTFGRLMALPDAVPLTEPSQPAYVALDPTRPPPPDGPPVSVVGRVAHTEGAADDVRAAEAADVAAAVARVVAEGWAVHDEHATAAQWRAATLGDITILVPARTSLPFLEDALDGAGVPFRTESSSLVYATRAVRDLFMVLRAIDDPTNELHVVSALRTPLLGCGDDDLFRFKDARGHWDYTYEQPDTVAADDPVRGALAYVRSLYDVRQWRAPSELLERVAQDRRALELGFAEGRPRDVWRRIRFVVDQARAWSEATGGNLRQYLAWVGLQTAEGARVAEAVLPETDDDAVRIMTIHSAKGLEFPVTIVSGMSSLPRGRWAPAQVVFPAGEQVGYRFSGKVTTQEYDAWKPIDEQMGFHERIRLLYVACTRARDHLVVSLHRKARRGAPASMSSLGSAELLVDGMGDLLDELPDAAEPGATVPPVVVAPPAPPPPFDRWIAERTDALGRASRPRAVAATALTEEGGLDAEVEPDDELDDDQDDGLKKRPRDLDLPPWLKGRYGSAVGRAVHGVLQTVDLATGEGLDAALAAQCQAEAVLERAEDVRTLVTDALGSPCVREASASLHWREVYVCTPVDGRLLEGYVDLLYRGPDGLVVVDYKTASTSDPAELDRRVERYRNQGASYALSVRAATGEPVVRVTFLFLTPAGAVERHLTDLRGAVAHARDLVTSGQEVLVP